MCKLEHNSARLVDYSPKENYIVTWSQYPMSRLQSDNHVSITLCYNWINTNDDK